MKYHYLFYYKTKTNPDEQKCKSVVTDYEVDEAAALFLNSTGFSKNNYLEITGVKLDAKTGKELSKITLLS